MKKAGKETRIDFISRDFKGRFTNIHDCPVARAIKRSSNWTKKVVVRIEGVLLTSKKNPTSHTRALIVRVVLNDRVISNDGFYSLICGQIREAFIAKPNTKAYFVLDNKI